MVLIYELVTLVFHELVTMLFARSGGVIPRIRDNAVRQFATLFQDLTELLHELVTLFHELVNFFHELVAFFHELVTLSHHFSSAAWHPNVSHRGVSVLLFGVLRQTANDMSCCMSTRYENQRSPITGGHS